MERGWPEKGERKAESGRNIYLWSIFWSFPSLSIPHVSVTFPSNTPAGHYTQRPFPSSTVPQPPFSGWTCCDQVHKCPLTHRGKYVGGWGREALDEPVTERKHVSVITASYTHSRTTSSHQSPSLPPSLTLPGHSHRCFPLPSLSFSLI